MSTEAITTRRNVTPREMITVAPRTKFGENADKGYQKPCKDRFMSVRHNPDGRRLVLNIILALLFVAGVWSTPALASVSVNKSFSPINIFPGQTSTLTINLYNSTPSPYPVASITSLTDTLPANVTATAIGSNSCGGTVSISPNTRVLLTGGTIPAASATTTGSCSFSVTVTSTTSGTFTNTILKDGLVTDQLNNPDPANATLTVAPVLGLTGAKSFNPSTLHVTGLSTATITLSNPNIGPLTNVSFTDTLPAPLVIATPVTTGGTCGGTVTATGGGTSAAFTGGTIPANGSCTVTFNVTVDPVRVTTAQNASVSNTIPANAVTTAEGAKNAASFSAGITVQSGAAVSKAFSPTQVFLNGTSTLTITLRNFNLTAITGAALTDTLPAGITAVGPVTTTCAGGTTGFTTSTITLTGATIPAATSATSNSSGSCTITATVKGTVATSGSNTTNSIAAGTFGSIGYSGTGNVSLTVLGSPVTVSKSFSPSSIIEGQVSTLTITLANGGGLNATITSFTDNLTTMNNVAGSYYTVASSPAALTSCVGSTLTAVPGATSITLSGGTIPANGNCQIIVPIQTPDLVGTKTNTIAAATGLVTSLGNNQNSATASLTSVDELTVAKAFTPGTVVPGGVSRLAITLNHNGGDTSNLTNISFTDNLTTMGAGHTVANPPGITNTCGGVVTAPAGGTAIGLSGGFLGIGSTSCQVQVNIQAPTTTGSGTNTFAAKAITTDQGDTNEGAATATLTRTAAGVVTLNTAFTPVQAKGGAPVVLSITFANNNANAIALTGVSLVDTLPTGLQIFTIPSASYTGTGCTGGTITAAPGGTAVTLTGAGIAANATCTLSVQVTGFANGNRINSLAAGAVSTAQGVTNTNAPSATVTILPNVDVGKYFIPATIETNGTSVLRIRLYNTNIYDATGAAFTDSFLPTNLKIAATPNATTGCGGSVTATANGTSVALSGGTIPANSFCDITVNVTAATATTYTNTIPVNGLTTTNAGVSPDAATAVLTVVAKPTITKSFFPTSIPAGATSNIAFTLQNPNSSALLPGGLTNASFTDNLPAGLSVDKNQTSGGTCVGANTNSHTTGQTSLSFSGITIPPAGSCTVTVSVVAPSATNSPFHNIASGVLTAQTQTAGNPNPDTAILTVVAASPTITKSFFPNPVSSSGTSTLTFTLKNTNSTAVTLSSTAFSDVFPTSPGAMTIASVALADITNTCGGSVLDSGGSALAVGSVGIRYNNGTIPANGSCTVAVKVSAGVPGIYQNSSSTLASANAGTSLLPATANLTILADADIAITKAANNSAPLVGSQFTFTVTATNNGPTPTTNVTVQDLLPSGYLFVSATPSQGTYSSVTGVWTIGTIGVGSSFTLDIVATVLATGTYANTASVLHSDLNDPVPANNTMTSTPVPVPVADVTTTTSAPAVANAGGTVLVPISFSNAGPSVANGVTYSALLPAGLSNVTCSGATCTYTSGTGAVAIAGLTGTLASGQAVNITLSYKAPASGSVTVYSNIATSTSQGANILPDTASSTTNITADTTADVTTTITPPASANAGSTVTVPMSFINLGPAQATGVTYSASLPAGLSGAVSCTPATTVSCSYNPSTGVIAITGSDMLSLLPSGSTVNVTLSYRAPPSGSVAVTSHIATTSSQGANAAPDTASGSTTIIPVAVVATTVSAPAVTNAGSTVTVPISFRNNGPSTAAGVTYALTLPVGLSGVSCSGATCVYSGTTVAISGLSGSLSNGQTENITLVYTAPASGSVTVTSTITTTTTPGSISASKTTTITGATVADVTTTVTAPFAAAPGSTVSVAISYLNLGPATAGGVTYAATLSPGLSNVSCSGDATSCAYDSGTGAITISGLPGSLTNGQNKNIVLAYTAPAPGTVHATSTIVTTTDQGTNAAPDTASADTVISAATTADVTTTVSAPASARAGSTASVGVSFSNLGPAAAAGVVYAATLPAGLTGFSCSGPTLCTYASDTGAVTITYPSASLGVGENRTATLAYTVPPSGSVAVGSAVSTTTTEANGDNNVAGGMTTVIPVADVTTTVSAPAGTNAGSVVSVPITFSNNGPSLAEGVTYLVTTVPTGLSGVSCSGPGVSCTYNAGTVTVSGLPTSLTALQTVTFTLSYTAPSSGSITVSSTVNTTTLVLNPHNTASGTTTVNGPILTVTKSHAGSFYQGQLGASYTITVHNTGSAATVGTITASDTLPSGLTLSSVTGSGWSCSNVSQIVTCISSAVIAAGGDATPLTLNVNVAQNASTPQVNSVTVSGGRSLTASNTATDSTVIIPTPDLIIAKSHTGDFSQGQQNAHYTITVTNAGAAASFGAITVIDTLPADLTYVSATGSGWSCTGSGQLATCVSTTSIAAGGTSTIDLVVNVALHATTPMVNAVSVTGGGEYSTANNTATDSTSVTAMPDLVISKSHVGNFRPGETGASYTITVGNIGAAASFGTITVIDALPVGLSYASSTGAGWSCGAVGKTVTCTSTGVISAGGSSQFTLTVSVASGATTPQVNNVTVSGGSELNTSNNTAQDSTTVTPLAVNDGIYFVPYHMTTTGDGANILANDFGAGLSVASVTGSGATCLNLPCTNISTAHGTVTVNADGTFSYTPAVSYYGPDSFSYTAKDSSTTPQTSNSATVSFTVLPPSVPPMALNDSAVTNYGVPVNLPISSNDFGGVSPMASPDTVITNQGVPVIIPVLANDLGDLTQGGAPLPLLPASLDLYPPNKQLTHTVTGKGTFTADPLTGLVTFTPESGFTGDVSISYTASDNPTEAGASAVITVSVLPASGAAPPRANDDWATTVTTTPVTVAILTNDAAGRDAGGTASTLTASSVDLDLVTSGQQAEYTVAGKGTFILDPVAGTVTFTAVSGFTGPVSIPYTVTDSLGQTSNQALLSVIVTASALTSGSTTLVNPATVDLDPAITGRQTSKTVAGEGTFTLDTFTGLVTFTPVAGFHGVTSIPYTVIDSASQTSNTALITVTVGSATTSAPPKANDDSATTALNTSVVLPVLINDTHGLDSGGVATALIPGTVTVSGGTNGTWNVDTNTGNVTYIPTHDYAGPATATYTVRDSASQTSISATLSVTVTGGTTATAMPDLVTTRVNTPVSLAILDNDAPSAGARFDLSTVTLNTTTSGVWTVDAVGVVTFTPANNFTGTATANYAVTDSAAKTANGSITVIVTPASMTAVDDTGTTAYTTPKTITVATNDIVKAGAVLDPATVIFTANGTKSLTTAEGAWQVDQDGSVTFTPLSSYAGTTAPVIYRISDSLGNTATATVSVTVTAPTAPVAVGDTGTTPVNTTLNQTHGLLENDSGTGIVLASITGSGGSTCSSFTPTCSILTTHGSAVVLYPNGTYSYSPNPNYSGPDSFSYTIRDVVGQTAGATVTLTVTPLAVADSGATPANTVLTTTALGLGQSVNSASILTNDLGSGLTLVSVTGSGGSTCNSFPCTITTTHGSVVVQSVGSYVYTPTSGWTGTDSFTYQIKDSSDQTSTAVVNLAMGSYSDMRSAITCTPDPATAGRSFTCVATCTNSSSALAAALNATCTFDWHPEGSTTSCPATSTSLPVGSSLTCSTSYTPAAPGTITITSASGADNDYFPANNASSKNLSVNAAPVATDDIGVTIAGTPLNSLSLLTGQSVTNASILTNDTGVNIRLRGLNGSVCSGFPCTTASSHGSVMVQSTGTYVYTPVSGYSGADSFIYQIVDEVGQTADATVHLTILAPNVTTAVTAPAKAPTGNDVSVLLGFSNIGDFQADGVICSATLPAGLAGVRCDGATCSYNSVTGAVTISGLPDSFSVGQTEKLILHYTMPSSDSVKVDTAITTTTSQGIHTGPHTATGTTTKDAVADTCDMTTTVSAPDSAISGQPVTVAIRYINLGPAAAAGLTHRATLPSGLTGVSCSVSCSYASDTGAVSITGLDAALGAGLSQNMTVTYNAPGAGPVIVTSITSATNTVVPGNITASAATAITTSATADVTSSVAAPAVIAAGYTVTVPITFSNLGPTAAGNVVYTLTVPAGLSGVSLGDSITFDYVNTTITIAGGLPVTLANGQTVNLTLSYTAPTTGPVIITSDISTTTTESNSINNSAGADSTVSALSIVTTTNGFSSNTPNGPKLVVSKPVKWSYEVTNSGATTLTGVAVINGGGATVTCLDTILVSGASTTCTAAGVVASGRRSTTGTVSGTDSLGETVTASNPDYYFGVAACDVNGDGKINYYDVYQIFNSIDQKVGVGDPRDLDGNGLISINDYRNCVLRCNTPKCQ